MNPSDSVKDRLTQSGGSYRERPKMIAAGFNQEIKLLMAMDVKYMTAMQWGGFTSSINKIIKELWPDGSVTRESLGIVAKARAMLYINGQVYPVSFDSKEELARIKVTDMILLKKRV
jgi:hypothetical protein